VWDKSDNILGVKGIGEKTAVDLLSTYNTLDDIYASLAQIKGATAKAGRERRCSSLPPYGSVLDVPLDVDLEDCKLKGFDRTILEPILEKLEFKSF